jgi:hypothetical protein
LRRVFEEGGEGAFGQAAGGRRGDLLRGQQVHVQARARFAEGPPGDNGAPSGCRITGSLEVLGLQSGSGPRVCCLGVAPKGMGGLSFTSYRKVLSLAKPVLASPFLHSPQPALTWLVRPDYK